MKNTQRLQILTEPDIWTIYGRPHFSDVERRHYFSLTESEINLLKINSVNKRTVSSKLYFILQFGYFKAKHLFFQFNYVEVEDDAKFILNVYIPGYSTPLNLPSKPVQLNAYLCILSLLGFQDNADETNELLLNKSSFIVQKTVNPTEIFGELKYTLDKNKIVLPPYSRLQDVIGFALKSEETRIIKILQNELTENVIQSLKKLLKILVTGHKSKYVNIPANY